MKLKLIPKQKSEDGSSQISDLISKLEGQGGQKLGSLVKEKPDGKLSQLWASSVADSSLTVVDVSVGISDVLSEKDEAEVKNIKRACYLLINTMKGFVVPELEGIIDEEKKVLLWLATSALEALDLLVL